LCYVGTGAAREGVGVNLVGNGCFSAFLGGSLGLKGLVVDGSSGSSNIFNAISIGQGWLSTADVTLQDINKGVPVAAGSPLRPSYFQQSALQGPDRQTDRQTGRQADRLGDLALIPNESQQSLTSCAGRVGCCVVRASAGVGLGLAGAWVACTTQQQLTPMCACCRWLPCTSGHL
jgi:hypothetical protein